MRNPKGPPPLPVEPFPLPSAQPARSRASTLPGLAPPPPPPPLSSHELGQVRRELAYFRVWLAGQLDRIPSAAGAVPAAPRPPWGPGGRRRELVTAAAGAALALLLALGSAAAALRWPAYGCLAARAARLGSPAPACPAR
jgi:hypothetical protein